MKRDSRQTHAVSASYDSSGAYRAQRSHAPADAGTVEIRREAGCVVATLTRPAARNRISAPMAIALMELAEAVEDDDTIRALAITGAGSSFSAGFDPDVDCRVVEALNAISQPTLAILNGEALDEGLELALALDLRIALSSARFALTQLQRGVLPQFGGTQRLPRLIGAAYALKMMLAGEAIDGGEAMRLGLVTYLAKDRKSLERIRRDLLAMIESRGPAGVRLVKEAVRKGFDMTLEQGIRLEEDLYALLQTTTDRAEGVRAFLEKRKPIFKGI
ncbi:MAG: enoyl-CoA hydratase/isomerase family protein [Deltaproteobacteria bacterium]|nr:enoyl-CoA hydratase/isomerase family protein [Deltaproteobacteria bacterium]